MHRELIRREELIGFVTSKLARYTPWRPDFQFRSYTRFWLTFATSGDLLLYSMLSRLRKRCCPQSPTIATGASYKGQHSKFSCKDMTCSPNSLRGLRHRVVAAFHAPESSTVWSEPCGQPSRVAALGFKPRITATMNRRCRSRAASQHP